ncbi:probable acyl-CoA dehydrogenase 6 [Gadus morhua]|uniref:Zgc:85777 n=1 Tax=Gadus morhua TaxID=8049 RepID=A0A8C5FT57_GADMO|nr:probable acyl-CoA dehydrogenase 6 [Gadus morhua]XP_056438916.1 probable acyl-CoA dehydrogenase 6 [Gadus chalcogrammus]XP_059900270.1 probable acyl-CoA dehydrogenase 6 [Gadus macrocephalus]
MAVRAAGQIAGICHLYRSSSLGGFRTLSQNVSSSKHTPSNAPETTVDHLIYTPEHFALKESIKKIIDQEINPHVDQWEAEGKFPAHRIFKILGNAGILGVNKPVEYGGLGLDFSYSVAVSEELGNIRCGGIPMAIGVQTDMATPALARFGSHELKTEFLLPSILGDKVACLGVSEVGAGSDVSSIMTKAVRQGDEYVINGGKMWTTNGTQADWMCLLANTSDGPPHRNKSLICLPMDLPGVHIARQIDKMGMRSSDTAEVFFDDVRVPSKNVIGKEGMGFTYQMLQFQEERLWAVANTLTTMDIVIQETIDYTRQRKIFKMPVLHHQTVHFRLAELQTEVELLRSLLHRATALFIKGNDVTKLASMAKLKAGRLARELGDSCLQYWGGMGFTNDVLVSRFYRDSRLISIGGGADEVMLGIICKYMDTLPK